jgi:hypothetical protein
MRAALALVTAVRARLAGYAPLTTVLGGPRVYDGAPRNAVFPYVSIDEASARDISGGDAGLVEWTLVVRAWSRTGGRAEALALTGHIADALDDQPLVLSGFRTVRAHVASSDIRLGKDRLTAEGLVRTIILIEPTA